MTGSKRRLLLEGGTIVTTEGEQRADVLVEGGRIAEVRPYPHRQEVPEGCEVLDCRGLHILPAAYDMHVHFRDPLPSNPAEDLTSGTLAAAAGGVCGFADMPNTDPMVTTPERWAAKMELAARKARIDYSFFPAVSAHAAERATLRDFDRTQIPGLKLFMGGTTNAEALDDQALEDGFRAAARLGVPAVVHAEDDAIIARNFTVYEGLLDLPWVHARIRDHAACLNRTKRAVELAAAHGAHLHVAHLSTAEEVAYLRRVQAEGRVRVTAEVTLHHLLFTDASYERLGHRLKCNPSVKLERDRLALWGGLRDGTISFIATDHAPHLRETKERPYLEAPSGVPATEMVMPVLLEEAYRGRIRLSDIVRWTSANVAAHYELRGKGALAPGYDADLVVVDRGRCRDFRRADVRSRAGYSPWEGIPLMGWPIATFLRGVLVMHQGQFAAELAFEAGPAHPLHFRRG